jgi:hypothetical protein
MPSTFSPSLRIELIGDGEQSGVWGQTTNNNLGDLLEQAIAGRTALNVTAGDLTLTSLNGVVDEARSAVLAVTGTPGVTRILTIPNVKKTYTVINSTANIVQIKTPSGTAYDCAPLSQSYVNCDGVNVVTGRSITDGANLITSLAAPFNSPSFTGNVGIGTATATLPLTIGDSTLPAGATIAGQMISSDVAAATALLSIRRSSASGNAGLAQFVSSGTAAAPTAVALNRGLGRNDWLGFDGTNYINAAAITTAVDGAVSTGVVPGRMIFSTSTTNTPVERMRITSAGDVGIGTSTPFTASTTFDNGKNPLVADGGYYGGGAYYNSTDWFNTTSSQGGWVIRNSGGVFTLYTGPNSGVAGTAFTDFAERVRVDSAGKVGIGTNAPACSLQVNGSIRARGGAPGALGVNNNGFAFAGNGGDADSGMYSSADGQLEFYTNAVEGMRVDGAGNVGIGTSTPASKLEVNGLIRATGITGKAGTSGAFSNPFNINWTGSDAELWIDAVNLGNIALFSDYRIKRNIQTQTIPALERVMQLRPVTYQMADYGTLFKQNEDIKEGFIAHEVQAVIPSGVEGAKDDETKIQSLRLDAMLAVAIKAIQEQQAIISAMEARLAALEA